MFIFAKEQLKYPIVATEDATHFIAVGLSDNEIDELCNLRGLIKESENIYKVYETPSDAYFSRACASFPRNLNPVLQPGMHPHEQFVSMHKYFYINDIRQLFVKGVYLHTKDAGVSPFQVADTTKHNFRCLSEVKLIA